MDEERRQQAIRVLLKNGSYVTHLASLHDLVLVGAGYENYMAVDMEFRGWVPCAAGIAAIRLINHDAGLNVKIEPERVWFSRFLLSSTVWHRVGWEKLDWAQIYRYWIAINSFEGTSPCLPKIS
jgi:hypothetical protein